VFIQYLYFYQEYKISMQVVRRTLVILLSKQKRKFRFEEVSLEGWILLQRIFGKWNARMWREFGFRLGSVGMLLLTQ
jgi:hypothetical protein